MKKNILILLTFSIFLSSCSRESKELNFQARCENVQNIIKKDLENYTKEKVIRKRMINRGKELNKLGKSWRNDNTYLSMADISSQIEKKKKEIDIEKNELYSALFLMMGLDKNSVSTNMEHLYGGDIKEKTYKKAFDKRNPDIWIAYTRSEKYEAAQNWYSKNNEEAQIFCKEFGINLLEPYKNFQL